MQWIPYRPEDMAFKQWRYNKKMFDFPKLQKSFNSPEPKNQQE